MLDTRKKSLETSLAQVTPIEMPAEEATTFFIICEHVPSSFDKLLNHALDFIGYDRIMHISKGPVIPLCM
jgi:hypothetical protein